MKKKAMVIATVIAMIALVFTGCEQATAPVVNVYSPDAYMNVTGFSIEVTGAALNVTTDQMLESVLDVKGLESALTDIFPLWTLEGKKVPYTQQSTVDVDNVAALLKLIGTTAEVVTTIDNPATEEDETVTKLVEMSISLTDNNDIGASSSAGNYYGDRIVIEFVEITDPTSFTNILIDFTAISSLLTSFNSTEKEDFEEAFKSVIQSKITAYYTGFDYGDPDEDDFIGELSENRYIFNPDNGQVKTFASAASLIKSLESINSVSFTDAAGERVTISIQTVIEDTAEDAIELRDILGKTDVSTLIVTLTKRPSYNTNFGSFTATNDVIEIDAISGYTDVISSGGTRSNLRMDASGNFTGALNFNLTASNDPDGVSAKTIEAAKADVVSMVNAADLKTGIANAGGQLPDSFAGSGGGNFNITATEVIDVTYSGQPDGLDSTIDEDESVTYTVKVTYTVGGYDDTDAITRKEYAFDSNGRKTNTVNITVRISNE